MAETTKLFKDVESRLPTEGADMQVQASYKFEITDAEGKKYNWFLDLKSGSGKIYTNDNIPKDAKPDSTFIATDANFIALATGKLKAQNAYMQGKLKLKGNMGKAMKLNVIFKKKPESKL